MIKLMKSTFYNEKKVKDKLVEFISASDKLSMGSKCEEFEKIFSHYQERKYSVLFNSGSSANLAIIQSLINLKRLGKGDKVGISAITWATNVAPIIQLGLHPVPIDVSQKHLNVSSETLNEVLSKMPIKALFLTNLLGFSGDIGKIREICDSRGIILIEDNCESLGSKIHGKKLGNFGLASSFSFFVGHHLSTIEGGMVSTDDPELRDMLIMVRAHGWSRNLDEARKITLREKYGISTFYDKYAFYTLGYNLRPTEITGFLGTEQMKDIDEINIKRNENFKLFHHEASKNFAFVNLDVTHMDFVSSFAYPLIFEDLLVFEKYKQKFEKIAEIRPIVGGSILEQPFFKDYLIENGLYYDCPNAKKIHYRGFYFPNNPELTAEEISNIISLMGNDIVETNNLNKDKQNSTIMKKALITGITGQDGSYLAEFLLKKGYEVHGLVRRTSSLNRKRLDNIYRSLLDKDPNMILHYGDMTDSSSIIRILAEVRPQEIYNLAAQSHVHISFEIPEYTGETDALGVLKILEAMKQLNLNETRIYQASTSELFGAAKETPQKETTPFHPRSPYGAAKLYAYWIVQNYREAYNIFACNGILFNHESPRRGENFVTKKITKSVIEIKLGKREKLILGNLNAIRDWGYAPDYVEAMWLMLQQETPKDYVIATGEGHTVREFVEAAFKEVGIILRWEGNGISERGIDSKNGRILVEIDPRYFRPTEVEVLVGDYSKIRNELGWAPKTTFRELVKIMIESDMEELSDTEKTQATRG